MSEAKHSSLKAEVVPVVLEKHPDADRLSVVKIDDFVCVTQTAQWDDRPLLGVYIQPDTLVDTKLEQFTFLAGQANIEDKYKIRARKIRGVNSFGLLVPAPEGAVLGSDLWEPWGLEHWNPTNNEDKETGFDVEVAENKKVTISCKPLRVPPSLTGIPKYDLENGRKYARKYIEEGEEVVLVEKVDGQNGLYCMVDGVQYVRSRTNWKNKENDFSHIDKDYLMTRGVTEEKAEEIVVKLRAAQERGATNNWWSAYVDQPEIGKFCAKRENFILFGEVYGGKIQGGAKYGAATPRFVAFDIMKPDGAFMGPLEAREMTAEFGLLWAPILYKGPFSVEKCVELAEGKTTFPNANHVREGVVVEPTTPRRDEKIGRVKFKFVGAGYLEKN